MRLSGGKRKEKSYVLLGGRIDIYFSLSTMPHSKQKKVGKKNQFGIGATRRKRERRELMRADCPLGTKGGER